MQLGRAIVVAGAVLLATLALAAPGVAPARAATTAAADVKSVTLGSPGVPFGFVEPLDQLVTLGDAGDERLSFVTPLATVPCGALTKTTWMDLGRPRGTKEFLDLIWTADVDLGSEYMLSYSVDGQTWVNAGSSGSYDFPDGTHGKTIAVRVWMTTSDANATPRVDDITIEWTKWKKKVTKPTGGGSSASHAGTNNGSGVYTFPSAQQAPAQPSQSTDGAGSGTGTGGSTSPGASGGGNGPGVAATTADTTPEVVAPAATSQVQAPPVVSAGEGDPTAVTGVLSGQGQQVSGVPYVPSGGLGSAGVSGTSPGGADRGSNVPVLLISSVLAVLGVVLFAPWLVTAASMRALTGYNARRARTGGPFGPSVARRTKPF
jgi:hypothetical protein